MNDPTPETDAADGQLRQRLLDIAAAEADQGASTFMGKPDRWWDAMRYRCRNGHVTGMCLKSEAKGSDLCLGGGYGELCYAKVYVTFPEDVDGPLPEVPTP